MHTFKRHAYVHMYTCTNIQVPTFTHVHVHTQSQAHAHTLDLHPEFKRKDKGKGFSFPVVAMKLSLPANGSLISTPRIIGIGVQSQVLQVYAITGKLPPNVQPLTSPLQAGGGRGVGTWLLGISSRTGTRGASSSIIATVTNLITYAHCSFMLPLTPAVAKV